MEHDRRTFLKTAGIAGVAAMTTAAVSPPAAQSAPANSEPKEMPKGMTFATLRRGDSYGLGLRTQRGVLDVAAAEAELRIRRADEHYRGIQRPRRYGRVQAARRRGRRPPFRRRGQGQIRPRRHRSREDRLRRPQLPRATPPRPAIRCRNCRSCSTSTTARSTAAAAPSRSRRRSDKFDYEAELVIVMGKHARKVSEAEALDYIFGYASGNDFTARDLQSRVEPVDDRQDPGRLAPIGPYLVSADQVDANNLKLECRVNGEVRQSSNTSDMVFNCTQHRQLHLATIDAGAGRHHLHRHAGGRDLGLPQGQAGLAQARRQNRQLDREAGRPAFHVDVNRLPSRPGLSRP